VSDLQDLIHTNAHKAYEIGVRTEHERIATILDGFQVSLCKCDVCKAVREIKEAIKGEQE
jgi:hypothetical protein